MIITNLKGGLGNQMFEYAAGLSLSIKKGTAFTVDISHFDNFKNFPNETRRFLELDSFNVKIEIAKEEEIQKVKYRYPFISQILSIGNSYLLSHGYIQFPILLNKDSKDIYLDGYFQNESYFDKYSERILKEFTLKEEFINKEFKEVKNNILNSKYPSVSLHIRRGDYVTNLNANKHHGVLDNKYYKIALKEIKKKYPNVNEYIFSDDTNWVRENFEFLSKDAVYVSEYGFNSAQEITLMSKCKNNIIANSSFSWWGAWLNQNKEKTVIAPKSWLRNGDGIHKGIVPTGWIRM